MKIKDIRNAAAYMTSRPDVDKMKTGVFGVCAGAGYVLEAASKDKNIRAVVTTASWLHDAEAVLSAEPGVTELDEKGAAVASEVDQVGARLVVGVADEHDGLWVDLVGEQQLAE